MIILHQSGISFSRLTDVVTAAASMEMSLLMEGWKESPSGASDFHPDRVSMPPS